MDDLWGFQQPNKILNMLYNWNKQHIKLKSRKQNEYASTFVGSRLTRPQARAATPLQLRETATIPIESGPGYISTNKRDATQI